jgi:hypothetical protein
MRQLLQARDYILMADGVWRKTGSDFTVRDDEIEDHHLRIIAHMGAMAVTAKTEKLWAWVGLTDAEAREAEERQL